MTTNAPELLIACCLVTGTLAVAALAQAPSTTGLPITTIDAQGGFLGPDLTDIGTKRAVRHLRESIVDPNADIPLDGPRQTPDTEVWLFDRLENIGGHKTTVLGEPKVVQSSVGTAVEFDGVDDALFIENHPLAGAATFTWEAIFRPDGGQREQRWFHLSERDPVTGADTDNRMLFEIRVIEDKWYLDSYNQSGAANKALMNRSALHPLGAWYHVASVYDGKEFRNYVDGVREGAAELHLAPHGPGHASVGVRINKVFYFKGAVHLARFTRKALSPAEFLKPPPKP